MLFVGPTLRRGGGIASVLRSYSSILPSFRSLATNSRLGPVASAAKTAAILLRLPLIKLAGHTDILHIHGATGKSWCRKALIMRWANFLGFKTVYHSHGGSMAEYSTRYGRDRMGRILRRCAAVATLSAYWQRFFTDTFALTNVKVINNIVEQPAPDEIHTTRPPGAPLRLLFLGTVNTAKGIFDLVETIAANASRWRGHLTLALAGDGPEMERLRETIAELCITDMVRLHGWVEGAEKKELFRQADAVILPSYIEGMPICILEGIARAMPVIATNVGGIPEILTDNVNGFIFPPGDTRAIASAINAYIADPTLLATHGAESLRRSRPFLPDAVRASLAALYRSL